MQWSQAWSRSLLCPLGGLTLVQRDETTEFLVFFFCKSLSWTGWWQAAPRGCSGASSGGRRAASSSALPLGAGGAPTQRGLSQRPQDFSPISAAGWGGVQAAQLADKPPETT